MYSTGPSMWPEWTSGRTKGSIDQKFRSLAITTDLGEITLALSQAHVIGVLRFKCDRGLR